MYEVAIFPGQNTSSFSDDCYVESANYSVSNKSIFKEKTAVSMLDLIDKKGKIDTDIV